MPDWLKLALRLTVFALVAALLLAGVNQLTEGPIRDQADQAALSTREAVLPQAESFEAMPIDLGAYPDVDAVDKGVAGDETVGYALMLSPQGYKGEVVLELGVNADGSVNALSVISQSETAGLGSRVADEPFLSQFPGIAADPDTLSGEVDAITGATVTSTATLDAVRQALTLVRDELGVVGAENPNITGLRMSEAEQTIADRIGANRVNQLSPYAAIGYPAIVAVYAVEGGGGAYAFDLEVQSRDVIKSTLVIGEDGVIRSLTVTEQHEGEGYGDRVAEDSFTGQFAGQRAEAGIGARIDALSGATNTYNNFMPGIDQAITYFNQYLASEDAP